MLSHLARHTARSLGRVIGQTSYSIRSESVRGYASSDSAGVQPKRRYGLKFLGGLVILGTGVYVGDLVLNDDLDQLTDRFRTRLTEEQRRDRYVELPFVHSISRPSEREHC